MNTKEGYSIQNIYQLNGRVPIGKAVPFGLQHILAMFVANLTPITIIAGAAQPAMSQAQICRRRTYRPTWTASTGSCPATSRSDGYT